LTEEAWVEAYKFLASENFSEPFLGIMEALADWDQALEKNENPDFLRNNLPLLFDTVDGTVVRMHSLAASAGRQSHAIRGHP